MKPLLIGIIVFIALFIFMAVEVIVAVAKDEPVDESQGDYDDKFNPKNF
jgi:hypothetical protein